MIADDLLDLNDSGMVGKDKGNPIAVAGGKRGVEDRSAGDGTDQVEGAINNSAGESSVEEEGGHFGVSLVEYGLNGSYVMEVEELGEWNGVVTGSRNAAESPETILVGDGHVKGLHIHGKQEAAGACKLEILKLASEESRMYKARETGPREGGVLELGNEISEM
eukprot:g32268.t1